MNKEINHSSKKVKVFPKFEIKKNMKKYQNPIAIKSLKIPKSIERELTFKNNAYRKKKIVTENKINRFSLPTVDSWGKDCDIFRL